MWVIYVLPAGNALRELNKAIEQPVGSLLDAALELIKALCRAVHPAEQLSVLSFSCFMLPRLAPLSC